MKKYCGWKGQATKEEAYKNNSTFLALKKNYLKDAESGDDPEVCCLISFMSHFFIEEKMLFYRFSCF